VIEATEVRFDGSFASFWNGEFLVKAVTRVLRVEPTEPQDTPEPEAPVRRELLDDDPLDLAEYEERLEVQQPDDMNTWVAQYRLDVPRLIAEIRILRDRARR
jgi:hypothetical protein